MLKKKFQIFILFQGSKFDAKAARSFCTQIKIDGKISSANVTRPKHHLNHQLFNNLRRQTIRIKITFVIFTNTITNRLEKNKTKSNVRA